MPWPMLLVISGWVVSAFLISSITGLSIVAGSWKALSASSGLFTVILPLIVMLVILLMDGVTFPQGVEDWGRL